MPGSYSIKIPVTTILRRFYAVYNYLQMILISHICKFLLTILLNNVLYQVTCKSLFTSIIAKMMNNLPKWMFYFKSFERDVFARIRLFTEMLPNRNSTCDRPLQNYHLHFVRKCVNLIIKFCLHQTINVQHLGWAFISFLELVNSERFSSTPSSAFQWIYENGI